MNLIIFLILLFSFEPLLADRATVSIKHVGKQDYIDLKGGSILFLNNPQKTLLVFSGDIKKLNNPIYSSNMDKAFWLVTESFVNILKLYKFKSTEYLFFNFYDTDSKKVNEDLSLKINLSEWKKLNNRDFSTNDKKLLDSTSSEKYKLLPLRDFFKKVIATKNYESSSKLTNSYKKFIDEYTFKSVGYLEFTIENNKEKLKELKKDIHSYCIKNNIKKVKLYIDVGFDVNATDSENNQTLLTYASINGHYEITKLLIDNGADPNIFNKGAENPYLGAKREGFTKIAKLLKPLTKMTVRPIVSTSNNFSASDLKNLCLATSGQNDYSCYEIQNKDIKNTCLGMTKYSDNCYSIQNRSLKNLCLSRTDSSQCYNIRNNDIKNVCLGVTKYPNNCYNVKDTNLKNLCLGNTHSKSNCYSIR